MKTKKAVELELKKIERLLCRYHKGMSIRAAIKRGKCKLNEKDRIILYGAAQALGWLLSENYMKASKVVTINED